MTSILSCWSWSRPFSFDGENQSEVSGFDFATKIEEVNKYGWYWGATSEVKAKEILANEPNGSFILRDCDSNRYTFTLTFKHLNLVLHLDLDEDKGKYSFGPDVKTTVVELIKNAVKRSLTDSYLDQIFSHRVHGHFRIKLTNPVLKPIPSLMALCKSVINQSNVLKEQIPTHQPPGLQIYLANNDV